jgi:bifunctional UDP-N-acetylglucosamine pyrophosphorylase/glucosamine-1-phosphate N-acetyltransferase
LSSTSKGLTLDPMTDSSLAVIILAAGQGTRMKSALPKVLHPIAGRPMLAHVLDVARQLGAAQSVVVTAPGAGAVAELAARYGAKSVVQDRQLGTGHAVAAAEAALPDFRGHVLVLFADVPLLSAATLRRLVARLSDGADLAGLGFKPGDPTGYGRMVCSGDVLQRIVEHKDASPAERAIGLCFAGMLAAPAPLLFDLLRKVGNENAQGEYYLTDVIAIAHGEGLKAVAVEGAVEEMMGVNSREHLAEAEAAFQARRRKELMAEGVSFQAPETVFLAADTVIEPDVTVGPYVFFGPGVTVRRGVTINAFCHIEGAEIGEGAIVGPFARLRPGAVLEPAVHVGNFVEVKNSRLEQGAKVNHLSYIGDARIGARTNIGAGTITCNYDGTNKHRTDIGADVFVGSDSVLVAPVTVGDGVYIGAGSVITDNIEADALALGRARQVVKAGGAQRIRARTKAAKKKD